MEAGVGVGTGCATSEVGSGVLTLSGLVGLTVGWSRKVGAVCGGDRSASVVNRSMLVTIGLFFLAEGGLRVCMIPPCWLFIRFPELQL